MQNRSKLRTAQAVVGSALLVPVISAHAALPAEITTMYTDLATDFALYLGAGFVLLAVVVGGMITLGWGKKVARKAAG